MKDDVSIGGMVPARMDPGGHVAKKLKELYDNVQGEGIPEKILDLLEKLDEAEKAAKK